MPIDDKTWASMIGYSRTIVTERIKDLPLIPDSLNMLKKLHKQNCQTALVTKSYKNVVGDMLEDHDLIGGFDAVICYEDVKEHKPHPEALLKAMEELGANPEETVMVGDGETDINAAKNAGIDSILLWRPENETYYIKKELLDLKPTHVVNGWDEFLKLVS